MKKIKYDQLQETLYTETMGNGLTVTLLPKNEFHKTHALFTTNYGSIDNTFVPLGKEEMATVPDGIAHFLEHKLFEKEDGDVFQKFGKFGASANAFTSFTRTSYLFSSTEKVKENLMTLIDFVQEPYFIEETVNKEKGIIAQEIQMYDDEPDWRLFFGLLTNLYPKHPLHIDIAGTVESIMDITADDLYESYHTFYHPSNMNLFVVGKLDPEQMMQEIRDNQKNKQFADPKEIVRYFLEETVEDIEAYSSITLPVNRPKSIIGVKGVTEPPTGRDGLAYKTKMSILLSLLFGTTSKNYLALYDSGLIDDSFSYDFTMERSFHFLDIGSDTKEPEKFAQTIKELLLSAKDSSELNEEHLMLIKKKMIGQHLQSLNSLEYIANQYSQELFGEATLFDMVPIIESIQLEDIKEVAAKFMVSEHMSTFSILPKGE
ncbi:EF-P 5-aminopentanol modification-associated protein YfmH [Desemzia sp. FAM 23989]|uniref:EF-P 5-aminopentanol modification-associated protein YfmH n=1 Tax=Desemzia sp. FAM 23989 TaxID=3259523 RepID=UPI00388710B5